MSKKELSSNIDKLVNSVDDGNMLASNNAEDSTKGWTWEIDQKGYYTSCSDEVFNCLGIVASEFINKSIYTFHITSESSSDLKKYLEDSKTGGTLVVRFEHRNGNRVVVSLSISPKTNDNYELVGWTGFNKVVQEEEATLEATLPAVREQPALIVKQPISSPAVQAVEPVQYGQIQPTNEEQTFELADYFSVLLRRKWVVILTTIFALAVVIIGVIMIPPVYTATAKVRALTSQDGSATSPQYNVTYAERLLGTYAEIAKSSPVLDELSKYVSPMPDPVKSIDVQAIASTEILQISVTDQDPALAQHAANKLAEILIAHARQLYTNGTTGISLYIVDPAVIPVLPSGMANWQIIAIGLIIGLFGGIGLAFIFENLDSRIYTAKAIEDITSLSIIGDIPEDHMRKGNEIEIYTGKSIIVEAYRRLRTNILSRTKYKDFKSMLVISSVLHEGRTSVVVNLGASIAQTQRKVIVVDADFRSSSIHKVFGLENEVGLSNFLKGDETLNIQKTKYEGLDVLTSGPSVTNPVEILGSPNMQKLVEKLKSLYDIILVDSPSCLSVTDSAVISTYLDGVLLVVRDSWVRREALINTIQQMAHVQAIFVGVVCSRTLSRVSGRQSKIKPLSLPENPDETPFSDKAAF